MATRKTNPEKDVVLSSASTAPARSRRPSTARPPYPASGSDATATAPARETETPANGAEQSVQAIAVERELSHEEVARLAYALWEARGCQHGNPEEDWLRAEQQLRQGQPSTNEL